MNQPFNVVLCLMKELMPQVVSMREIVMVATLPPGNGSEDQYLYLVGHLNSWIIVGLISIASLIKKNLNGRCCNIAI